VTVGVSEQGRRERLPRDTDRAMSQENVEIAARWYEVATSKTDLLTAMSRTMSFCHPDVEWSAPEVGTTYRGHDGVRQRLEEWLESFGDYRYEIRRIIDCGGDEVLVEGTEVGRGARSGAEVRTTDYELLTFRDGMIVRIREYYDEAEALAAAGLSE
jgi:ketosteroid isomerase-like protein